MGRRREETEDTTAEQSRWGRGPGRCILGITLRHPVLHPLIGAAIGAGIGALTGSLTDVGIDDDFIKNLKDKITPGTSALFVLTSDATLDRVHEEFEGQKAELISTNLSHEQEATLRSVFAE